MSQMKQYVKKFKIISAVRWYKPGDHVDVTSHALSDAILCGSCDRPMNEHGWLHGRECVCPGAYVLVHDYGTNTLSADVFHQNYEELYADVKLEPTEQEWKAARKFAAEVRDMVPTLTDKDVYMIKTGMMATRIRMREEKKDGDGTL